MKRQVFSNLSATAAMLISLALAPYNQTAWAVGQEAEDQTETVGDREEPQDKQELREFQNRGDIQPLPRPRKRRLIQIARRPHSFLPITAFSEADDPSQLFQFYLDTTDFQPNVFTSAVPGINDTAIPTAANAANDGLPTIGSVRVVLEPKLGLPTDPNDVRAFIARYLAVRPNYRLMPAIP